MIAIIERQVFDFLGFMWSPIVVNFLQIIFVIMGLIGTIQYRPKVVVAYTIWCLIWIGWNIFIICFYLEVGILDGEDPYLNMGTGNKSWWLENGYGCTVNSTWTREAKYSNIERVSPPEDLVQDCLIQYYYVEIIHAGIQILLALIGLCISCIVIYVFTEEDDSSQPVQNELVYIKMRYRSPARNSFRDKSRAHHTAAKIELSRPAYNAGYDTVRTQHSADFRSEDTLPVAHRFPHSTPNTVLPPTSQPDRYGGGGGTTTAPEPNYNSDDALLEFTPLPPPPPQLCEPEMITNGQRQRSKESLSIAVPGQTNLPALQSSSGSREQIITRYDSPRQSPVMGVRGITARVGGGGSSPHLTGSSGVGGVSNAARTGGTGDSSHGSGGSPRTFPRRVGYEVSLTGDLGYESYDSRRVLISGHNAGQSAI